MGKGTFGKVFKCKDRKRQDTVAVKVVRKIPRYVDSAKIEGDLLDDVYEEMKKQDNAHYCVKMYARFHWDGNIQFFIYHLC